RYPELKHSLRKLLQFHRMLGDNPALLGAAPPTWPEPGQTFLGFTLLRELGRGAFARVYLASETALGGRLVAGKVSPEGGAEADMLGRLQHPGIVPVHSVQVDQVSGLTAVCMPYLGNSTLGDVMDHAFSGPVLPNRARVILEALQGSLVNVQT